MPSAAPPAALPKVLVVDDERGTRESLRFALQRDYTVVTAASVEEALELLHHQSMDTIVLDLRLPGMDGIEGLRQIRDLDPDVAVVILTAYASLDTAVQALRLGANDYRLKPFDVPDLLGVVRRNVAHSQNARRRDAALASDLQRINDNLAARLAADDHLAHVGQLAAALMHDLNGMLTTLTLSLDLLGAEAQQIGRQPERARQAVAEYLTNTKTTLDLITRMIRTHQRYSRPRPPEREQLVLDELLNAVLRVVNPLGLSKNCRFERWTEWGGATVTGDRLRLFRVFYNILVNALDAVPAEGGLIRLACEVTGNEIIVSISDNGPGIPAEALPHLFERYFTTKAHGTGLGLHIAQTIVHEHGGHLAVASTVGTGTVVTVRLPGPPGQAPAGDSGRTPAPDGGPP